MNKITQLKPGDYVRFHCKHGHSTGIIETIYQDVPFRIARICVRNMSTKPKRYYRPLFKLKKIDT